jgi:hypothetical protein
MHLRARRLVTALAVIATMGLAAPAAAFAVYGAISVHLFRHGITAWGNSWNYPTKSGAKRRATRECEQHALTCHWVLWVRNSRCGAVNRHRSHLYVAFASSEARAEAKILAAHPRSKFIAAVCGNHA